MKFLLLTLCMLICFLGMEGQTVCTAPGQNPTTAFPVCGTSTFTQNSVPICGGRQVPAPTCNTYPLADVNPYWYKFTCFQAGTLGFRISPATNSEDYDWQLFDITGRNPNDVYTDVSLVKACNWSGEGGATGASSAGSALFVCEGLGKPLFSKMPDLQVGHEYLLLVSHFTQTQSGYSLSFNGGTAVITDSTPPKIRAAEASCGGNLVRLKEDGVPIIGFTWYSLIDQVDWDSLLVEDNNRVNRYGLFDLDRRIRPVGECYRDLIQTWRGRISNGMLSMY